MVKEYSSEISGYDVTNKYTPGKTSVQVTKAWLDGDNQDGVRPESVTINLLANGTDTGKTLVLSETNKWTGSFTELDEYKDGVKIDYTIEEVSIENGYKAVVSGDAQTGYEVTNSRTPDTISVEGKKTWEDNNNQDGKRPESITIRLLKNGEEIDSKTVTEKEGWKWSFTDLAKYEKGEPINYTITEDAVKEYSSEISGYDVTNSYIPEKPEETTTTTEPKKPKEPEKRLPNTGDSSSNIPYLGWTLISVGAILILLKRKIKVQND